MADVELVDIPCPLCGASEDVELYPARLNASSFTGYSFSARRARRREHYRVVRCADCSLVRSNPILTEGRIDALYKESEFMFAGEARFAAQTYGALFERLFDGRVESIARLLEIGCSTGFFLEKALDLGMGEVVGFEPSADCVAHASERVRPYIIRDVYDPEQLAGQRFDVVCSFHVFDHLRDPAAVLRSVVERLNPGGAVVLVCHDVESWSARLLGDLSPIFDVEHVCLFSQKTMAGLLESAGLEVMEVASLSNTYPLGYWARMLPVAGGLARWLPGFVSGIPVALSAGNLFGFGRKGS